MWKVCRLLLLRPSYPCTRARARSCIFSHISFSLTPGIRMSRALHPYPPISLYRRKIRCTFYQGAVATIAPAEQTRPAFFPSFSRINNSPVYTRRVKLTVYYPLGDGDKFSEAAVRAFRGIFVCYSRNESKYICGRTTYLSRLSVAFCSLNISRYLYILNSQRSMLLCIFFTCVKNIFL